MLLFCFIFSASWHAAASDTLAVADSLFLQKKYTESFEIYKSLLEEQRVFTPAMLLKMAYIKEGLGGYSDALYYLNLYYLHTADKKVLMKMEELAKKKELSGYDYNDFEFAQTIFYKYFTHITGALLAVAVFLLSLVFYLKVKKQTNPVVPAIGMVLILSFVFYLLNFGKLYNKAIIDQSNTYFMSGPSAGAEVLKILNKGNRLKTLGEEDVWTKVEFNNQIGYIKTDKLKKIGF